MNGNAPVDGHPTGALAVRKVHRMFMILFNRDDPATAYTFGPFATKAEAVAHAKAIYNASKTLWVIYPHIQNADNG